jgi:hypothetical protein
LQLARKYLTPEIQVTRDIFSVASYQTDILRKSVLFFVRNQVQYRKVSKMLLFQEKIMMFSSKDFKIKTAWDLVPDFLIFQAI